MSLHTILKKLRVLKELKKNKNIVILKPDKGNGVAVLDRTDYDQGILKIINDTSKFRPIKEDPTLLREGRLQRLLRKLKKDCHLANEVYENIYPKGSQPARIYGLPKMHKDRGPNSTPPFRPIVSSIGTYNYNLAKYLCNHCPRVSLPTTSPTFYFKLPYIGHFSVVTQKKIRHLIKRYCNDLDIKLVFSSFNPLTGNRTYLYEKHQQCFENLQLSQIWRYDSNNLLLRQSDKF